MAVGGNQSSPGWAFGFVPTSTQWNAAFAAKVDSNLPIASAGNLTLGASGAYAFTGTTGIFTMPTLATGNSPFDLKNMGSGNLTVTAAPASGDQFYTTVSVGNITIAPGGHNRLVNYGTIWSVE